MKTIKRREENSRNGLTFDEEKQLRRRAKQVDAALTRKGNFGHREVQVLEKLRSDLLTRLDPPSVEGLEQRAEALLDPMLANPSTFYWLVEEVA